MITPQEAVAITTRATEAHARAGAAWGDAVRHTVRSLIDRLAATRGLPATGLDYPTNEDAERALDELCGLDDWHILDIGEVHQRLLELTLGQGEDGVIRARKESVGKRGEQGAWYTPPELAREMCRLTFGPQLDRLSEHPDPLNMLQILAIDPACGAGVFLLEAARLISGRFAGRLYGIDIGDVPEPVIQAALPDVMRECIFGIDIDPVAVDLAKATLWLETGGREPFTFLDRNIICGNALDLDQPPAFTEKRGDPPTAELRRKAFYAATP